MITRWADKEDLPQVFVMYLAALEEIGTKKINEAKALDYVISCWNKAPCILLEKDGEVVGFAGLNTMDTPYNDVVRLTDFAIYIQPPHRSIRSWRSLCKAIHEVADKFKLNFVGENRLTVSVNQHLRLIKMAGAKPLAIQAIYGDHE